MLTSFSSYGRSSGKQRSRMTGRSRSRLLGLAGIETRRPSRKNDRTTFSSGLRRRNGSPPGGESGSRGWTIVRRP